MRSVPPPAPAAYDGLAWRALTLRRRRGTLLGKYSDHSLYVAPSNFDGVQPGRVPKYVGQTPKKQVRGRELDGQFVTLAQVLKRIPTFVTGSSLTIASALSFLDTTFPMPRPLSRPSLTVSSAQIMRSHGKHFHATLRHPEPRLLDDASVSYSVINR
ncbi:hypothetical protein VTO73DRAFT_13812 [Trametes versicolor]